MQCRQIDYYIKLQSIERFAHSVSGFRVPIVKYLIEPSKTHIVGNRFVREL